MAEKRGWLTNPATGEKFHAWSHVKSIFYNKASNILLKDKLDEMDKLIDEKIKKTMMSNVQVNDQNKVPTSALVYTMQQGITNNRDAVDQLNRDISDTWGYYMADSFNVDTAGNCILWINTYTESFLGTHPFRDDHYMLISINDNGNRLQVGISMHQGIKSRYAIPGGSWDNWV